MDIRKLVVGLAVGGAAVGAGFSMASAQTAPPPETPPSTEAPAPDDGNDGPRGRRNCDKDGDGRPDQGGTGAESSGFFET